MSSRGEEESDALPAAGVDVSGTEMAADTRGLVLGVGVADNDAAAAVAVAVVERRASFFAVGCCVGSERGFGLDAIEAGVAEEDFEGVAEAAAAGAGAGVEGAGVGALGVPMAREPDMMPPLLVNGAGVDGPVCDLVRRLAGAVGATQLTVLSLLAAAVLVLVLALAIVAVAGSAALLAEVTTAPPVLLRKAGSAARTTAGATESDGLGVGAELLLVSTVRCEA